MSTPASMDRRLERKPISRVQLLVFAVLALALITGTVLVFSRSGVTTLRLDPARLTVAAVQNGEFRDYYPVDGRVAPATTVFLDVQEGGRVEEILVAGGHPIEKGQLIMRLSNPNLQRGTIETETRLIENLDQLRNTELARTQSGLQLRDSLVDLDHQITELESRYGRLQRLGPEGAFSVEAVESVRNDLVRYRDKRELLRQRIEREEVLGRNQLSQAKDSIERVTISLGLLRRIFEGLDVRASTDGFLSSIDVEVGQSIPPGTRIGQIDQLDAFKLRASIDQFYLSRVEVGTPGKAELGAKTYAVEVKRVYPEVANNVFTVDLAFTDAPPTGLRRGQRLTVELSFGEPVKSLILERGGFLQTAGGKWVYLIDEDGRSARRVPVRFGRQNPRYLEVLEGLRPGDRIVTSSYSTFNDVDELRFSDTLPLPNLTTASADGAP